MHQAEQRPLHGIRVPGFLLLARGLIGSCHSVTCPGSLRLNTCAGGGLGPTPASLLTLWHRTAPTAPRFSCLLDPRYPAPGGNGERLEGDEGQEPSESSLLSLCMFCSGWGGAQWLSGLPSVPCSAHRGWPWPWEAPPFPTVPPALGLVGTPAVADVWGGLTVHHWLLSSCIPM